VAEPIRRVLSIAGSDSGGGAGIQADLKALAVCGVHGMTAITAVTAQNTVAVTAVHAVPPAMIVAQVAAVVDDIGVDAVKIGMLGTVATIDAVRAALELIPAHTPVVLDPVMVAESGAELLESSARQALIELMLPAATVLTPNIPEARVLAAAGAATGATVSHPDTPDDVSALARAIHALGPDSVVVTGGHRDETVDVFFDGTRLVELSGERVADGAAHGSGCTHSSALAAYLALGHDPLEAARRAKELATEAIRNGLEPLGAGVGPVDALAVRGQNRGARPNRFRS
jgi:hydroxymethylpyrimidine/phosphomethylpyrimidine kinase